MRIGIDGRYAFRAQRRGIGEYVAQLLEHLSSLEHDHEFHLYLDRRCDVSQVKLAQSGQFHIHTEGVDNPLLFEQLALPMAAARDKVDLLHFTANYGASIVSCQTVYTIHDLIEFRRGDLIPWTLDWRHRMGRSVRQLTLGHQARTAARIITPSEASKKDIAETLKVDSERVLVIPHGAPSISPSPDRATLRRSLHARGYDVPENYILTYGALDPRKNTTMTIEAFDEVHVQYPHVELWVVGVEQIERYRSDRPWIHVLGYLPRVDVDDLLRGAIAFIYSSNYEGFGLPLLEAMAAGTPLIASSAASIPEVVGDAGLLFPPTSMAALQDAIKLLLSKSGLPDQLRRKGFLRAKAYSWSETARRHLAVYDSLRGHR